MLKKFKTFSTAYVFLYSYLFLFLFLFVSPAYSTSLDLKEYLLKNWTAQSGLPHNSITALVQTQKGYIWIGTPTGLVRFDGVRFETFRRDNSPLKNDQITTLYEDASNVLWIGTNGGGLFSYEKESWTSYSVEDGLSNSHIRTLTGDWHGNLWVGTDYGLNRLDSDGIQSYTTENGLYDNIITALTTDIWGNLWVGTLQGGLAMFNGEVIANFTYDNGLLNVSVQSLFADRLGNIWIGTLEGLFVLRDTKQTIRSLAGTSYTPITSLIEDKQGALWIGTMADGLKCMLPDTLIGLSSNDGLPDNFIRCLLFDSDENIWIGTDNGGLIQLKKSRVRNITRDNGLPENAVYAVLEDQEGSVWIGTRNSGLCKMRDTQIIDTIDRRSGLSSSKVRILLEDKKGLLWVGTEDGGVNILQNGQIRQLKSESGVLSNNVTALLQDKNGIIWIGTDKGLNKFSDGKMGICSNPAGLANYSVNALLESRRGVLYVGTSVGLFRLSENSMERQNLLEDDLGLEVLSLYEDGEDILWIGTNGNGLIRRSNTETTSLTTAEGLWDNYIFSFVEDEDLNLWISSNKGVFYIHRKELNNYVEGKISSLNPTCFDEADGMASSQCSGRGQPSVWKTGAGQLFYPTGRGVVLFDPSNLPVKTVPPRVFIEEVLVDNHSALDEVFPKFSPRNRIIEFSFTAIDFSSPEKIRFKYRIEGHDQEFKILSVHAERTARYLNLTPGKYRFSVTAANNDGIWNEEGAFFDFEILFPFYEKPLFFILLAFIILSIGTSGIFINHRKKEKKRQDKYKTVKLDPDRAEGIVSQLLFLMEKENIFLDPDLTLSKLAQKLRIHYNQLSRIINERFGLSYNDFVNKYRIEEVKKKLTVSGENKSTILDIIYSTGFYSKSVFNTAFKKFTGMTPSEYRKKNK